MEEQITPKQQESIKLMKMSKGYQWEIRIFGIEGGVSICEADIKRLQNIDNSIKEKWEPQKEETGLTE